VSRFRSVTRDFSVSAQIGLQDLVIAKSDGFERIANNRPDGESADQPHSEEIEAAAHEAGLVYAYIPVAGRPTPAQVEALLQFSAGGRTLAFCRSGTRSILTWALGQLSAGVARAKVIEMASQAGYDLDALLPR
jgi:uncharacterized protein (TIGR01244 family)